MTKDLLNEVYVWVDQVPAVGSSDATSDGTINVGPGVRFDGYRYATLIAMAGSPSTSDGTIIARLQYAGSTVATSSDTADTDFANFATDAVSASLAFLTSEAVANSIEGVALITVDLWATGFVTGTVRSQILWNGTGQTGPHAAVIILSRRNGGPRAQTAAVLSF